MTQKSKIDLCLGIDPQPHEVTYEAFSEALSVHTEFLKNVDLSGVQKLKPNLSFFLRYGAKGIACLEEFCAVHRSRFDIIIDAKFNEISNSLAAQLDFVFKTLGAAGVTINPFLGEKTIEQALVAAVKTNGNRARVYVLCATSEFSQTQLSYLQQPELLLQECSNIRTRVLSSDHPDALGVVVGANRTDVLLSDALHHSGCAVLAPGLGAQNAEEGIVSMLRKKNLPNEFTFPLSRGIFMGGTHSVEKSVSNYQRFVRLFRE